MNIEFHYLIYESQEDIFSIQDFIMRFLRINSLRMIKLTLDRL